LAKGISIPQEIGVIGYDNLVGIGNLFLPPLSTVQIPHYEIGRLSTLHIIKGDERKERVLIDSPWLSRESF
jgi:DNA-binding LacI/PurR family transcriptional regulator